MLSRWATGATAAVPVNNDVQAAGSVSKQAWSNRSCEHRGTERPAGAVAVAAAAVQNAGHGDGVSGQEQGDGAEEGGGAAGGYGLVWTQLLELHGWYQQR